MSAPTVAPVLRVPCKLCGRQIIWAVKFDGGRIPLDPVPPCYYVSRPEVGAIHGHPGAPTISQAVKIEQAEPAKAYPDVCVSHFVTCTALHELRRAGKVTTAEQAADMVSGKGE